MPRGRGYGGSRRQGETPINKPVGWLDDPGYGSTGPMQPRTGTSPGRTPRAGGGDVNVRRFAESFVGEKIRARTPDVTNREVMGGSARLARLRSLRKRFYG